MKKSLIALAVLAASGAAMAQSSVTLFGIVDATLAFGRGSIADKNQLTNSGYNSSRIGFRGTEDLGGGMSASFWLEAAINNDNGEGGAVGTNNNQVIPATAAAVRPGTQGLTFARRSTVSLSGGFGELRLGRDYTPQFWNLANFDPFGYNGVGTTVVANNQGGPVAARASNSIGYFLPGNLGGFYGQAQYYLGENLSNAANKKDGTGGGVRLGYANGPINVALAASSTDYLAGDIKAWNIGGSYDLGVARIMGHYYQDKAGTVKGKGALLGALVPVGVGQIRFAVSTWKTEAGSNPKANKIALGYVHNLSKRTALYTTVARVNNKGGAAIALNGSSTGANSNSTGLDIGLRHSF